MSTGLLISAMILGAAGSLHCAGMCGPLCILIPVQGRQGLSKFLSLFSYQLGRVSTYASIGLLIGLAGRQFYVAGYQQLFSILLGLLVVTLSIVYFIGSRYSHKGFFRSYYSLVQRMLMYFIQKSNQSSAPFLFGIMNGLLPCGMVYMAALASISLASPLNSMLFMVFFGAGTIPAMMLAAYAGQTLKLRFGFSPVKILPFFMIATGCLLVLRGMNLGIPFLSPEVVSTHGPVLSCGPSLH
jgi:uncharacterized protein